MEIPFIKMNGAGNDFVIFDARKHPVSLSGDQVRSLASRTNKTTEGCDQVIVIEPSQASDVFMRIYNADGGEVDACGNATRCVGWLVGEESGKDTIYVTTKADALECGIDTHDRTLAWANMGKPRLGWKDIPLASDTDTLHLDITEGPLADAVGVSMGNPHAVFFVENADKVELTSIGPKLEHHALFPERANISVAEVQGKMPDGRDMIRLRVWERGTGETPSCGTGACAALVAANRRGLTGRDAMILANGGLLRVIWREDGDVTLSGPVQKQFQAMITL